MPRPNDVGVGVAVIVFAHRHPADNGFCVLLGKRIGAHGEGLWSFPSGWIERYDESIDAACLRELREEVGDDLRVGSLHRVIETVHDHPDFGFKSVTLFRWASWLGGEPALMEPAKCAEWRWLSIEDAMRLPLFAGVGEALACLMDSYSWMTT